MSEQNNPRRKKRSFTKEFRDDVVALVRQPGNTAASVARDMDLSDSLVRDWVRKDDVDNGRRDGVPTETRERLAALERENRTLREERDILKGLPA